MDKWKIICTIGMALGILIGIMFIMIGWHNASMSTDKNIIGQNVVVIIMGMFFSLFFLLVLIHGWIKQDHHITGNRE